MEQGASETLPATEPGDFVPRQTKLTSHISPDLGSLVPAVQPRS
ncbi:MAG: hypothetical protein JWM98_2838, partial [Thermoleophilia bacterium]|nr:hypothetical protein [Thermoleophilia bacterium]